MQIKALLLAPLLAAGLVDANSAATSKPFEIMTLRSASPIHFSPWQAARNSFFLQLPNQKAVCKPKSENEATFQIVNGELYLYSTSKTKQKVFTDRSGMGQGVLQYTSSTKLPAKFETKGWAIDKYGNLNFKGASFLACPGAISGSWSLWVWAGVANPGGNKNCLGLVARTAIIAKPSSCTYTVRQ